jgi:hypothetical protein
LDFPGRHMAIHPCRVFPKRIPGLRDSGASQPCIYSGISRLSEIGRLGPLPTEHKSRHEAHRGT